MIKEIGSSASYDLQFYNFFFPLKNQYKKKVKTFYLFGKKNIKDMIHFSDEETTVEVRTLPKPDPSVIVQVEAKRGKISFVKGNKI